MPSRLAWRTVNSLLVGKFGNRLGDRHRILRGQGDAAVFLEHVLNGIMHTIGEGDAGQRVLDDEILAAALIEFRTEPRQLFHRHPLEICHYHKRGSVGFRLNLRNQGSFFRSIHVNLLHVRGCSKIRSKSSQWKAEPKKASEQA